MSDDSFIREVDEELRSDRMQDAWRRYGRYVIAVAVGIVLLTAGYRGYQYYLETQAARSGDAFLAAVELANDGKYDEAVAALQKLSDEGSGSYAALAKLRLAAERAKKGEAEQAIADFDAVAADKSVDEAYRSVASLRAGLLMVDHGTLEDVTERVEKLAGPGAGFRHSAREALGLAHWKAGDLETAARWFNAIAEDTDAPGTIRGRANLMLDLIAAKGGPARKS